MKCLNCEVEISTKYRFALRKNECPACGKEILKEEDLVLIEEIETTILEEINVREESAQVLALALIGKFNINFKNEKPIKNVKHIEVKNEDVSDVVEPVAQEVPSSKQLPPKEEVVEEIISDEERKSMLEKIIKQKYNIDISSSEVQTFEENEEFDGLFSQNNILELERLQRLEKQKNNPKSKIKRL